MTKLMALLIFFSVPLYSFAQSSLNLYVARSPHDLNWDSPSTLARTLLKNSISGAIAKRGITLGHVDYELFCEGEEPFYAGMHYLNKEEGAKLIFEDKTGLGLLFHNMAGRFDTSEDVNKAKKDFDNGKTSILTLKFSNKRCHSLKKYLTNFLNSGEQYNYGLNNNPFISQSKLAPKEEVEKFVQNESGIPIGAGCTAFVVSSLQELGVFDLENINQWYSKVKVPEKYIGQYSDQIYKTKDELQTYKTFNQFQGKQVSIKKIITKAHSWAKGKEAGKEIVYYSPNLMFTWIENIGADAPVGKELLSGKLIEVKRSPSKRKQQAYHLTIELE